MSLTYLTIINRFFPRDITTLKVKKQTSVKKTQIKFKTYNAQMIKHLGNQKYNTTMTK